MTDILLVGCGKMGRALLDEWLRKDDFNVVVINPSRKGAPKGVDWFDNPGKLDHSFHPDLVVFAIKPQSMADIVPLYRRFSKSVYVSIAAGKTLRTLEALLENDKAAIVRCMPNLPASVGAGACVAVANDVVSVHEKQVVQEALQVVGTVDWIEEEGLMNAVTALSGSGPAYVFALVECLALAGEELGLDIELATKLARQTVIGSGLLLSKSSETATSLREAVTSPNGTTEAALKYLMAGNGLSAVMKKAMQAAAARAEELAS